MIKHRFPRPRRPRRIHGIVSEPVVQEEEEVGLDKLGRNDMAAEEIPWFRKKERFLNRESFTFFFLWLSGSLTSRGLECEVGFELN